VPESKAQLDSEVAAHADTKSKLAAAKNDAARKVALAQDLRAKLAEAETAAGDAAAAAEAQARLEQQLKDANAALARKGQRIKEVSLVHLCIDEIKTVDTMSHKHFPKQKPTDAF
jgi:hypothetical protein